jgi:hypothetical protein
MMCDVSGRRVSNSAEPVRTTSRLDAADTCAARHAFTERELPDDPDKLRTAGYARYED